MATPTPYQIAHQAARESPALRNVAHPNVSATDIATDVVVALEKAGYLREVPEQK